VHYYIYGVIFNPSSDASASSASFTNNSTGWSEYENCSVLLTGTNSGNVVTVCGSTDGGARWRNCTYRFANAGQGISSVARVMAEIEGGSILSGGTAPSTSLFKPGSPSVWKVSGMDLTNGATAMNLTATTGVGIKFYIRNCKLPASWSGSLNSSAPGSNSEYEMHNCDSGDTNYRYWRKTQYGEAVSETTIIKTGGASDGTTGLSWKLTSNASAEFPHAYFKSGEIVKWNETTGSAITVTVDVIHSGVGGGGSGDFTDKELWLEVEYFGTSGFPLGSPINDRAADILGAAADQDNSSATWTSEPATPVKQKLNVTFTPQEKGYIYAKVCLAVASKTVYVDFEPVVT
jgi:hypothetical protein